MNLMVDLKFNKDKKITFIGYSNGANFILGILQKRPDIADRTLLLHPADLDWKFNKMYPILDTRVEL